MLNTEKKTTRKEDLRQENPWVPVSERIRTYDDFHLPLAHAERIEQARRCLNCGVPFCQSALELHGAVTGCPLHNLIPEFNEQLALENDQLALERLLKTNPFPEFTARVCPALCEKACIHALDTGATTIHDNEFYIIENGFEKGWLQPLKDLVSTGKKVAVVGSGPAGLSAAYWLQRRGHQVDVFEREDQIGGLLMYGIPNMKLEKDVIRRRQKLMEAEGVRFFVNCNIGKDIPISNLSDYDAIILATGAKEPRSIPAWNRPIEGVEFAVDYLSDSTRSLLKGSAAARARNKNVIVVGGGDTGNDCLATAIRQGANSVVQLEMMPKKPEQRKADNPWPEWPNVDKIDYGTQEAMELFGKDVRQFQKTIREIHSTDGKISAVTIVDLDDDLQPIEGSEKLLECDLLLIAAGFTGIEPYIKEEFELDTTARNTVQTNDFKTDKEKLFACGDARRGQSLVVWAIKEGKDCAKAVDQFLMGYSNL